MSPTSRITTADAAHAYDIPERTIRRWHAEGRTTEPLVHGNKLWWLRNEIDQLAHQRKNTRLPRRP